MKKYRVIKRIILTFVILFLSVTITAVETIADPVKQKVFFVPIHNCRADEQYDYLATRMYSIFTINLKNQDTIDLMTDETNTHTYTIAEYDFENLLEALDKAFHIDACIIGDYYVSEEILHISIMVIDMFSRRIKSCYIERLPADLDMISGIEEISRRIAGAVAHDLPPLQRDALVQKHINAQLRKKIDSEEKLLDEILHKHNEIQAAVFCGIHTGRTIISWSNTRPILALPLYLEYSYYFENLFHIRANIEYLPFDLMINDVQKSELGLGLLFGFHTESLFSFSCDVGLAFTYDDNAMSTALSDEKNSVEPAKRFSLSIPLQLGLSWYIHPSFFLHIRLRCFGFTYTFESLSPHDYDYGNETLLYSNGFSPFSFLCISLAVHFGVRF
jgi:hypothetical protein